MKKLARQCYALPQQQKYPIHTKQAAQQSFRQFQSDRPGLPDAIAAKVIAGFRKAASIHGISLQCQNTVIHKKAFEMDCGNRHVTVGIPENTQEILQFALNLENMRDSGSSVADLRKMAKVVLYEAQKAMEASEISLQALQQLPIVKKAFRTAGLGVGNQSDVCEQLLKRASMATLSKRDTQTVLELHKNLKNMPQDAFIKAANLDIICDTLEKFDNTYDLTKFYGKELRDPVDVCYSDTLTDLHKKASDFLYVASTDTVLSKKALLQKKQAINSYFQRYFDEKVQKQDELLKKVASLPSSYVQSFIEYVENA